MFIISLCGELTVGRRSVKKASQELNSKPKVMGFLGRYILTSYSSARALTSCIGKTLTECDVYMVSSDRVLYISNVRVRHAGSESRYGHSMKSGTGPDYGIFRSACPAPLVSTTTLRYVHILSPVYSSLRHVQNAILPS